ncbi:ubiquitin carboxyl-terminal hydrolase [Epithele typhae]|uniref:ubiquitin carboxyl-terminal hydrolase n=1 Tax=Epithele typhae TaxID=378194 RepID=UPI002008C010|nr:ubiquitin carboxyl-terminal hydrolase [Epithele typhae]KAH9940465.1 ubiquitin carboxyl-terminal hydrolase [Epithele typhae]
MSGDDDSSGWQLTESDPGVFSELLNTLGVPLVVDDLYSLDATVLSEYQPIRALIFLFKWVAGSSGEPASGGQYDTDFPGFFAHQVVNNACATLAVMNAIANVPGVQMGPQLSELFSFTAGMDPQTSGLAITSSDWLREAHNALSPPSAISLEGLGLPKTTEDAYHFVVYIPYAGSVYELDGLKQLPVRHGAYSDAGEGWLAKAREVIEARIATYPPGALEFSLLAVHDDPLPHLQEQLAQLQVAGRQAEASDLMVKLANENAKRENWAFENGLRRHNYLGFIHALLLAMAKAGTLNAAKEGAQKALQERIERRKKGEGDGESMDN